MTSISSVLDTFQAISQGFSELAQPQPFGSGQLGNVGTFTSVLSQIQTEISQLASLTPAPSAQSATSTGNSTATNASSYFGQVVAAPAVVPSTVPSVSSPGESQIGMTSPSVDGVDSFGESVVTDAEKYLGVPYRWGGTSPVTGFDCSGFTQHVFADLGVSIPRTAAEQSQIGTPVSSLAQAQPGDLVFYGSPAYHVGIYIGSGKMIDAPTAGQSVSITDVGQPTSIVQVLPSGSFQETAATPSCLAQVFDSAEAVYGLPPGMLEAVAKVESNFNPSAVSSAGAEGIMQIMPQTASSIGVDPMNTTQAIYGAAYLLAQKLQTFGSVPLALAAYNAGDGAVAHYGGVPPYPETQNYVKSVLSIMQGGA
jgi:cell wall-associated NlpC family hydrolase